MGPKLTALCEGAGFEIIKVNTYAIPASGNDRFKRLHLGIFQAVGGGFVGTGMMTEEQFKNEFAQLTADIMDESRTAHTPLVTQIAARKI